MQEIKETCYKGTRILIGMNKRVLIDNMATTAIYNGFSEIQIPIIQHQKIFAGKVGEENNNLMFNFKDRANRELCLAPEYTAIVQQLAQTTFKHKKDIKLFYVQECFRGEKPQAGRYRQFTQFGVEILNPTKNYTILLSSIAMQMVKQVSRIVPSKLLNFELNKDVTRGLDYYKEGKGFEITCDKLASSKQICGGGQYDGGIGFAIGVDRLLELIK